MHDRTRQINRSRAQLLEFFPELERTRDLTNKGPVLLLTAYQTPAAIRRTGVRRLETGLRNRKVKGAGALAPRDCKSFGVTPDHGGCTDDQ
ncbi:hypothetical protein [Streptomyces sp. 2131.1]|uniref:hypothetical protein n=1 Tax=Streptomyces sp. 2131.1 TaxID=1855346 RepID=UPI00210AF454|nr:hypothetical protein [Streptomyces sp. 2131.1]